VPIDIAKKTEEIHVFTQVLGISSGPFKLSIPVQDVEDAMQIVE
jgi:hypothetical protein